MDESETSGAAKRQVFVRCNGRALRTTVAALTSFFESCGKPTAILNKWGEEPVGGAIYEVALVTFKKNKACEKAIALSGGDLDGRPLVIGLNTKPPARRGVACAAGDATPQATSWPTRSRRSPRSTTNLATRRRASSAAGGVGFGTDTKGGGGWSRADW